MPTQGHNNPGAAVNDPTGTTAWTNASDALSDNGAYAIAAGANANTQHLVSSNYGFTIPPPAVIDGIEVIVNGYVTHTGGAMTGAPNSMNVWLDLGSLGTSDVKVDDFPGSDGNVTFGGATDLWGATPGNLLGSNMADGQFSTTLKGIVKQQTSTFRADVVTVKVWYTDMASTRAMWQYRQRRV